MSDKEVVESLEKQELSDLAVTFNITPSIIDVVGLKQPTLGKNQFRVKVNLDSNQDNIPSTHLVSGAAVAIVNRGKKLKDVVVTEETSGCWKVEYHIHEEGVYVFIVTVDGVEAEGSPFKRIWSAELPKGTTVDRGQDWKWGEQGGGDVGIVLGSGREVAASDKWVKVMWKNGGRNNYRWGAEGAHDLMIIDLPGTSEDYAKDMDSNILAEEKLELLKSQFDVAKILLKKKSEELKETKCALEIAKAEITDLTLQTSMLKANQGYPSDRDETVEYDKWDDDASSEMKRKLFKGLLSELNIVRSCLDDKEKELEESRSSLELILSRAEPEELDPLKCTTRGDSTTAKMNRNLYTLQEQLTSKGQELESVKAKNERLKKGNETLKKEQKSYNSLKTVQNELQEVDPSKSTATDEIETSRSHNHERNNLQISSDTINKSDADVQFDFWVPMEDLLHGATVVDEAVFDIRGHKEQEYPWVECGFSLFVPKGALSKTATCPVAVKALISGRFQFPKGFQLISALYAISPGRKFVKNVKLTLQHCFLIERKEQLNRLCIVKAYPTEPKNPYVFNIVEGGIFEQDSQYCDVWMSDFSIVAAVVREANDGNSQSSSDAEGSDNTEESEDDDETGPDEGDSSSKQDKKGVAEEVQDPTNLQNEKQANRQLSGDSRRYPSLSESSASSDEGDSQLYRAHFFMESISRNKWNFKLVGVKHLDVHIKFVNDKFNQEEQLESFKFRFIKSKPEDDEEPAIKLLFTEKETKQLPQGWFVMPISDPCSIPKEEIDALSSQDIRVQLHEQERVYSDIPMRKASVFAEDGATPHMKYGVKVEGIKEKKTINIVQWFNTEIVHSPQSKKPTPHGIVWNSKQEKEPNLESEHMQFGDLSLITDCNKLRSLLSSQLDRIFADLEGLLQQETLELFTSNLFQIGLISPSVKSSLKYSAIMTELKNSFKFKRTPQAVIAHCHKILSILADLGEPQKEAAHSIAEDMTEAINKELNVTIKIL